MSPIGDKNSPAQVQAARAAKLASITGSWMDDVPARDHCGAVYRGTNQAAGHQHDDHADGQHDRNVKDQAMNLVLYALVT